MQTFYTHHNFAVTAQKLDYRRLGKQRVEAKQILMTLLGESKGWRNHPAVRMWEGYETALCWYGMTMCWEWRRRNYVDNLQPYFQEIYMDLVQSKNRLFIFATEELYNLMTDELSQEETNAPSMSELPWWMDPEDPISDAVIASHRSNLIRKKPEHYSQLWPELDGSLEYLWPV